MKVFLVVDDACCDDDDAANVLGCFSSLDKAKIFADVGEDYNVIFEVTVDSAIEKQMWFRHHRDANNGWVWMKEDSVR